MSLYFNTVQQGTVGSASVKTFLCPSDSNTVGRVASSYIGSVDFGDNNYYTNQGTLLSLGGGVFDGPAYIMGAAYGGPWSLATITDGTSNTAIFSEGLMGNSSSLAGPGSFWVSSALTVNTTSPANPNLGSMAANLQSINSTYCNGATVTLSSYNTGGFAWISSGNGIGGLYSHAVPPNQKSCWGTGQDSASPIGSAGNQYQYGSMIAAKSNHNGGVNMGFLDGSVRFIKNSINAGTYGAIGTMKGGEVIDANSM
jgi:prepilin-type processing-associated H-X9-DG protein